ncbi:extracellular solute-binding protein [Arthrobacter sp. ISL-30]|uniref:extracellular solute-binding protein n=1 Tax=Arthrobacter sp. ISL-30 TaxID=2819109 RepID=UPI001BE872C3|nr:extracellular solute-binding protein [Arthrobacter sp. ISL-30]MBT2514532.1 extracellular solute-binding protein [Arthrobacter sp. ISL-30]
MNRRKITLATAVVVAAALGLTACGGGEAPAADSKSISIMAPFLEAQPPATDGAVQKKFEELTGKDVNITWVPNSSYGDKMNITLASTEIPQIMVVQSKSPGFVKNAEAGAFWDLTDKLKDYPNLKTTFPEIQKNSSVNGKVYGVFRARGPMRTAVMFRQDWLDKLGLKAPETTEDLYNVAKAFTERDPDGNGQNDTWGITIPKWGALGTNSPYDFIETWYGAGNRWTEKDGKLIPSFETEEFLEANRFVKKMVDEKLINPDFATFDGTKWNEPFFNGKGGMIVDVDSRVSVLINLFKQANPNDFQNKVGFVGNLQGPDGELRAHPTDGYSGFLAVPKASVRTEAELKNILSFLDKMNGKELATLFNNGIEGVNFAVEDGKAATIKPETPEGKVVNTDIKSYAQLGTNVTGNNFYPVKQPSEYEQKVYDDRLKLMAEDLKSAVYNPAAPYVSPTYVAKGAQLDNIVADARIKYLAGQINEQGLKDAIQLWSTSGGDKVKEEINKLWQENR